MKFTNKLLTALGLTVMLMSVQVQAHSGHGKGHHHKPHHNHTYNHHKHKSHRPIHTTKHCYHNHHNRHTNCYYTQQKSRCGRVGYGVHLGGHYGVSVSRPYCNLGYGYQGPKVRVRVNHRH